MSPATAAAKQGATGSIAARQGDFLVFGATPGVSPAAPYRHFRDREALLEWLRRQRLAMQAQGWLMVHAGVVPQWDTAQTLALADEVHALLMDSPKVLIGAVQGGAINLPSLFTAAQSELSGYMTSNLGGCGTTVASCATSAPTTRAQS